MRTVLFICALALFPLSILAQDISEAKKVPTNYDRSSLTILFLEFGSENHFDAFKEKAEKISFSDKYDNNNLSSLFLKAPYPRSSVPSTPQQALNDELLKAKINQQIINKWYSRQPDGSMSLELVHQRGRFSATDADFLKAQTSKRGNAALEDYGNRLVNLSYILIVDVQRIQNIADTEAKEYLRGYKATVSGFLYKINFDENTQNAFYDTWIYDDDTEAIKAEKRKKYEELNIPVNFITQKTMLVTASQPKADKGASLLFKYKSDDELLQELAQKCYDEVIYLAEKEVEQFKVKTPIYTTRPIKAKIGMKEGLKTDYRFYVYEFVYNSKTGQADPKQRGVIRAKGKSKIVDNRKVAMGDMEASEFYQVAGRKLEPGFTIQQQNDMGVELIVGGEGGNTSGLFLRADYRLGRFVGIRSLFVYLEGGGLDSREYLSESSTFFRYGGGLAKGFQLMRNIELRPYIGFGLDNTSNENILGGESISSIYVRAGANLALNLKHNFQFVGGIGSYSYVGYASDSEGNTENMTWDEYFDNKSGAAAMFGIKFMF